MGKSFLQWTGRRPTYHTYNWQVADPLADRMSVTGWGADHTEIRTG